jgi:high-affinity iron transporter
MLQSFIILFRETLEAALVIGIVVGYLVRTGQRQYRKSVYLGLVAGVGASVVGALGFQLLAGGFSGRAEAIFEGITMLAGAVLLTTLILWMIRKSHRATELERKVADRIDGTRRASLFLLIFFTVLREGIESVIFLSAARFASGENNLLGAALGLAAAVALALALFRGVLRLNLRAFFTATNVLLILFAAGLVAGAVHELEEAEVIPMVVQHLWDVNPTVVGDGYPVLHENGLVGSIAKGLFGYNGNPSLIEVVAYLTYLVAVLSIWLLSRPSNGGRRRSNVAKRCGDRREARA